MIEPHLLGRGARLWSAEGITGHSRRLRVPLLPVVTSPAETGEVPGEHST
ncbi:hypothetical protein HMPREF9057_03080 [Actinomyces sp. oral taxon 171 str. F0337]|nr:hypothetical protein HMPREF9057_03080 [Actinomyces sp. oral taxon 171 str. F0337]